MWTPNNLSVFLSVNTLMKPSISSLAFALELAKNGKDPLEYYTPAFFNSSSVFPTVATSGLV